MKKILLWALTGLLPVCALAYGPGSPEQIPTVKTTIVMDSVLRHVVLFKFKPDAPPEKIREVEAAFKALPEKIPQIVDLEWGLNNSPEGKANGFTHCFFLTFKTEADRAAYLPHPDHKAFGALLGPYLDDVLVIDYWTH